MKCSQSTAAGDQYLLFVLIKCLYYFALELVDGGNIECKLGGLLMNHCGRHHALLPSTSRICPNRHPSYLLVQYFMLTLLFVLDPSYFAAFGRNENAGWFSKRASKISVVCRKYDVSSSILAFVDDMHIV